VKSWGKAVLGAFAPRFLTNDLRVACFNMANQNQPATSRTISMTEEWFTQRLNGRHEWVINRYQALGHEQWYCDLNCVVCNMDAKSGIEGLH